MYPNHLTTLVASALLLAVAAPPPAGATPLVYTQLAGGWYNDKCGTATFRRATSGGSPAAADCRAVAARYAGFDGGWHMSGLPMDGTYQTLASHGHCAFGVRPRDGAFHSFYVGASDIADLVRDAGARFARNGRLGAEGNVQCGGTKLQWAVYRV